MSLPPPAAPTAAATARGSSTTRSSDVARPCSCRPQRLARKKATAVQGRLPKRFREVSFDREPVPSIARRAPDVVRDVRRYARTVAEQLAEGRGLWFTGSVGTGKTTLAMLVSKAAMEADHTVAIYSLPRLLSMLRGSYDDDAVYSLNDLIERLCAVDLLHVDDVGAEQTSPWVLEQLYTIVNTRYEDGRAVMLTTNLPDDELKEQIGAPHRLAPERDVLGAARCTARTSARTVASSCPSRPRAPAPAAGAATRTGPGRTPIPTSRPPTAARGRTA